MARKKNPRKDAEKFFYDNAGYSYDPDWETKEQGRRRTARLLAEAEQWAEDNGYEFEWEDEQESWDMFLDGTEIDPDEVSDIMWVGMKDASGEIVQSLGGIIEGYDSMGTTRYRRVVEAELALEEMMASEPLLHRNPTDGFKISPKQWRGYFAMHKEPFGPSANDGYNLSKYGITSEQYRALLKIASDAGGSMDAKRVTKAQIQKLLRGEKVMLARADPRDIERVQQAFVGVKGNPSRGVSALKNKLLR